ncbi:MAG: hydroxymethylbilane synthase [Halobacteriales archaeon]|nr:hydroxymethylbilane synthase [Halobacteriales archaeon]
MVRANGPSPIARSGRGRQVPLGRSAALIRLGTRGSPLALVQANLIGDAIRRQDPGMEVRLEVIRTHGDEDEHGNAPGNAVGKALFTHRIEEALVDGRIDAAVHSLKDLPNESLPGVEIAAVPVRADPRDVLVSVHPGLQALPHAGVVATSSLRRSTQLLHARPDLRIEMLSGNVGTRLRKLEDNGWDGIVLAAAGLVRLGIQDARQQPLPTATMLPAPGQGALAIQAKRGTGAMEFLKRLEDPCTRAAVDAERSFSLELGGDCNVPVAALASCEDSVLRIEGLVASTDGKTVVRDASFGNPAEAANIGRALAERLISQGAAELLAAMP